MNTLRNRPLRVVASSLLFVILGFGAQAFVSPVFGCGQGQNGGCVASTDGSGGTDLVWTIQYLLDTGELIFP